MLICILVREKEKDRWVSKCVAKEEDLGRVGGGETIIEYIVWKKMIFKRKDKKVKDIVWQELPTKSMECSILGECNYTHT